MSHFYWCHYGFKIFKTSNLIKGHIYIRQIKFKLGEGIYYWNYAGRAKIVKKNKSVDNLNGSKINSGFRKCIRKGNMSCFFPIKNTDLTYERFTDQSATAPSNISLSSNTNRWRSTFQMMQWKQSFSKEILEYRAAKKSARWRIDGCAQEKPSWDFWTGWTDRHAYLFYLIFLKANLLSSGICFRLTLWKTSKMTRLENMAERKANH